MIDPRDTYEAPDRAGGERAPSAADRIAIEDLFARYAWAVDTADIEAADTLFTAEATLEDSVVQKVFGPPTGARDFVDYFRNRPVFPGRQHWVSQLIMTMVDDDTCRVRSFATASHLYQTGANYLTFVGSYADTVVRTPEGWKFHERRFYGWDRDTLAGRIAEFPEDAA
jgi:hypothetical protein